MGVRFPSVASTTLVTGTLVTTAETIVLTTPPINEPIDNAQVLLFGYCAISVVGTAATFVNARLRRGTTLTSPLINVAVGFSVTATGGYGLTINYPDLPGIVAGQQYSLTLAMTAATGNSTIADGCLMAMVL